MVLKHLYKDKNENGRHYIHICLNLHHFYIPVNDLAHFLSLSLLEWFLSLTQHFMYLFSELDFLKQWAACHYKNFKNILSVFLGCYTLQHSHIVETAKQAPFKSWKKISSFCLMVCFCFCFLNYSTFDSEAALLSHFQVSLMLRLRVRPRVPILPGKTHITMAANLPLSQ